jgi:hypothetical protein
MATYLTAPPPYFFSFDFVYHTLLFCRLSNDGCRVQDIKGAPENMMFTVWYSRRCGAEEKVLSSLGAAF